MSEEFNPQILFKNIDFLIKNENRKIGEVEKEAGVSAGYISRTSKDGGGKPGIEFIMNIANVLHVSIDTLLNVDISSLTTTEQYLLSFLEKLEQDTRRDLLSWERFSATSLMNMSPDENGNVPHPLFAYRTFYEVGESEYPEEVSRVVFSSHTFDVHTCIHDDCYELQMKNGAQLHIMNISKSIYHLNDPRAFAKEIWMSMPGEKPQYLCSNYDDSKLANVIDHLYVAVKDNCKHPKIKKDFRDIIDSFMKGDNKNDFKYNRYDEESPF